MGQASLERPRLMARGFGWVDHRLVREGYVQRCSPMALALYLVLVTVSDAAGSSFYKDRTVCTLLRCTHAELVAAREALVAAGLIVYRAPFYQVLSLEPVAVQVPAQASVEAPSTPSVEPGATRSQVQDVVTRWLEAHGHDQL